MIINLSELYFRKIYYDFNELWQQDKQLKTMEMSEVSPDTHNEGYIHQF